LHPVLESLGNFSGDALLFLSEEKISEKLPLTISWLLLPEQQLAPFRVKIIGNLENPYTLFSTGFSFKRFWSNNTIVGGLAFGLIGVELAKKIVGHKESTGDLITFPLMLAIIIGRIGCFFTGIYEETYGLPTDSILECIWEISICVIRWHCMRLLFSYCFGGL
jgi:hypothetical protein